MCITVYACLCAFACAFVLLSVIVNFSLLCVFVCEIIANVFVSMRFVSVFL